MLGNGSNDQLSCWTLILIKKCTDKTTEVNMWVKFLKLNLPGHINWDLSSCNKVTEEKLEWIQFDS